MDAAAVIGFWQAACSEGLDICIDGGWAVDALRRTPHPTHAHLEKTLSWIARAKPRRAILTHMGPEMLAKADEVPEECAEDGLVITL